MPSSSFLFMQKQIRERLLTESEQAELLTCSVRHLQNLRRAKLIPYVRLGPRLVRYDPTAVERAIQKLTIREHGHV
jgi:Helix-turn-helix domain